MAKRCTTYCPQGQAQILAIPPPSNTADVALLRNLSSILKRPRIHTLFQKNCLEADSGVRQIQGDRYEVFVYAKGKSATMFSKIAEEMVASKPSTYGKAQDVKDSLIRIAKAQSKKDSRFASENSDYDNFSLLINYEDVQAQHPHLDLLPPNHQCGLLITDGPGTLEYQPSNQIATIEDLHKIWPELPANVLAAIRENDTAVALLRDFGNLLSPRIREIVPEARSHPAGTLLSTPGNVIHAGPSAKRFRVILFFSACPQGSDTPAYNPDTQYFAPSLCAELVIRIWDRIERDGRVALLTRLLEVVERNDCHDVAEHFSNEGLQKFLKEILSSKVYKSDVARNECIQAFASRGLELLNVGAVTKASSRKKVSSKGLCTVWQEREFQIEVYPIREICSSSNKRMEVYIFYPSDNTWEKGSEDEPYTLEFGEATEHNDHMLFNGSNGVLRSGEGDRIDCYTRTESVKESSKQAKGGLKRPLGE